MAKPLNWLTGVAPLYTPAFKHVILYLFASNVVIIPAMEPAGEFRPVLGGGLRGEVTGDERNGRAR